MKERKRQQRRYGPRKKRMKNKKGDRIKGRDVRKETGGDDMFSAAT